MSVLYLFVVFAAFFFTFVRCLPFVSPQIISDSMNIWRPLNLRCTKIFPQYIDTEYSIGTQQSFVEVRTAVTIITILYWGVMCYC